MATSAPKPGVRGFSRYSHPSQAQTFADLLDEETRPVPESIRNLGIDDLDSLGPTQIPTRWYLDRAIHELEREKIWKRKWQYACRVDHIPVVGDTFVYDVAGLSFVIVRVTDQLIKGYWNACLHRGVPIRQRAGRVDRLQCPYHGFTWDLGGTCQMVPYEEEFPHIDPAKFALPEVQVATWQGCVFINPDLNAESLESYMGAFADEFDRWPFTNRQLGLHIAKIFPANWKVVQEAFMESFHVLTTHPQYAATGAERCSAYGVSGNFSRGVAPIGQTNDYVANTPGEELIWLRMNEVWDDEEVPEEFKLPPGMTARQAVAERNRNALRPTLGSIADEATDTEVVDIFYWTLFPNFAPLGHFTGRVDRFMPYGDDHEKSVMETMFMAAVPEGAEPAPPGDVIWLGEDEDYTKITQLGAFGAFLSQDIGNLEGIMKGLRNNQNGYVNFARNFESKIRHFYGRYEEAMELSASEEIAALESKKA